MSQEIDPVQDAVSNFIIHVESGQLYNAHNQCLGFATPPPFTIEYDTFFACLAHHVKGSWKERVLVRDALLCHLGALVFNQRFERANDVVDVAMDCERGAVKLKAILSNGPQCDTLFSHGAIKTLIQRAGAYHGCVKDPRGGGLLKNDIQRWKTYPAAFAYVIGCFVRDNIGTVPSAPPTPRRRKTEQQRTVTTCVNVFLHLALDVYPGWRPMLWRYDSLSERVTLQTDSHKTEQCPIPFVPHHLCRCRPSEIDEWHNSVKPLYMFYNNVKKRFALLELIDVMHNPNQPPPNALFQLRKGNAIKRKNKHVSFLLPHAQNHTHVHRLNFHVNEPHARIKIARKYFYSLHSAQLSDATFRIERDHILYIYAMRPTQGVLDEYKQQRLDRLWDLPMDNGASGRGVNDKGTFGAGGDDDVSNLEAPEWARDTTHVMVYKSHEARTGLWPCFMLDDDTIELVVVVAIDKSQARALLQQCYPKQPYAPLYDTRH